MEKLRAFLKRKNIEISAKRYGIDALGGHGPGPVLLPAHRHHRQDAGPAAGDGVPHRSGGIRLGHERGGYGGGHRLRPEGPPLVLFSLVTVGYAANALGSVTLSGGSGAGGPLAVLFIAVIAAELGKAVSKETKIDILVTPLVTILAGVALSAWWAPAHPTRGAGGLRQVGHCAPALLDGHPGVGGHRRGPDPAHLLCRHLRRHRADRPGRRGRSGGGAAPTWWASPSCPSGRTAGAA